MDTSSALHQSFPYFTAEHEMLRQTVRRFVVERVSPFADRWEQDGMVPRAVLQEMGALGLFGIRFEAEYGGSELDTLSTVVLAEELGRSTFGGFAVTVLVHTDMAAPHLHHAGNLEQKGRFMADLVAGRKIAAVAMTEPDAGSDLASMRTTARRVGNQWELNGAKMFITNGVHGDVFFVAAKTGESGRNHQVSMFIGRRGGTAPPPRARDRGRVGREPVAHALHRAGGLSLAGPRAAKVSPEAGGAEIGWGEELRPGRLSRFGDTGRRSF